MNKNVSEGKWKQMRGQAKVWWGKVMHNDREQVSGNAEKMIGTLQEKVGQTQQKIEKGNGKEKNDSL